MKPYSWEHIESVLKKELNKTKHIMTFGTIGSRNVEHDIDVIITKKPSSKTSDFYKEVYALFDEIDNYLRTKYNSKIIRFARMNEEIISEELSQFGKNDLAFHTMIYTSFPQIEKDWARALFHCVRIDNILKEGYSCLLGDVSFLFKSDFMAERYCDPLITTLYLGDVTHSNYVNKKLQIKVMNHLFDYIYRKQLKLKSPVAKNQKEVRKYIYQLCDLIDKFDVENPIK